MNNYQIQVVLLKTLHLLSNRWNSAITEYALSSVRSLMLRGGEHIFCPIKGSPAEVRAKTQGIEMESQNSFGLENLFKIQKTLKNYKPEVVFCYGGPELSLMILLKATGFWRGVIIRFRGQDITATGHLQRWKYRISHSQVSLVIAPSFKIQNKHTAIAPFVPCERVLLGCPLDLYKFRAVKATNEHPQIILLGRLDPVKGHDQGLRIFSQVIKQWDHSTIPHPVLHIIGEPANLCRDDLIQLIIKNNLTLDREVYLTTERVNGLSDVLSRAKLGFITSLDSEVICRVAEEFLLCGTPILISGVGSLEEVLVERGFGASYKSLEESATASLMKGLLIKSHGEDHLAKLNRSVAAQKAFSWEAMGERLEKIILATTSGSLNKHGLA